MSSPPSSSSKNEEFKQLPRAFKQLQFQVNRQALRTAPTLKELPSVLIPSNDRRVPFPPRMHYGYPLQIERMDALLEQKLGAEPGILDANPLGVLGHLRREVFHYNVDYQTVYLDGTDSMFFLALCSKWELVLADRLEAVVKKMKEFLEVDEEPVWCLDTDYHYWRKCLSPYVRG